MGAGACSFEIVKNTLSIFQLTLWLCMSPSAPSIYTEESAVYNNDTPPLVTHLVVLTDNTGDQKNTRYCWAHVSCLISSSINCRFLVCRDCKINYKCTAHKKGILLHMYVYDMFVHI